MLLMMFVNDLWAISGYPEWLGYAERTQDMLGLADIVFFCFLFVVGLSIPFAIERCFSKGMLDVSTVGHILTRSLALLLMGVFSVNTEYGVSTESGLTLPVFRILMVIGFLLVWNVYLRIDKQSVKNIYFVLKIIGILLLVCIAIVFRDTGGIFQARWWGILGLIGWILSMCFYLPLYSRPVQILITCLVYPYSYLYPEK